MKRLSFLLIWLNLPVFLFAQHNFDSLLNVLDKTLDNYPILSIQKENRLNTLKNQLLHTYAERQKYEICEKLFNEYNSYKLDSALMYAKEEFNIAKKLNDLSKLNNARLNIAIILGTTGMYKESLDVLQNIHKEDVPALKIRYFNESKSIYGYMTDNAVDQEKNLYAAQLNAFRDSLLVLKDPSSITYVMAKSDQLIISKKYDQALKLLLAKYATSQSDINVKAFIEYTIACIYKGKGDRVGEKYWLILSAINDIKSQNKAYVSLRVLALNLLRDGDIDRAYRYMKRSLADALFCDARLRTAQITEMLPVIDKAYQAQTETHQTQLKVSLIIISFLSLILLIVMFFVYKQMTKLSIARKDLIRANEQLKDLNLELFSTNSQLTTLNKTLQETNLIKEEYIGRYMDLCSVYIDKLDGYRRMLNKIATAGKIEELLSTIKSKQVINDEIKQFYITFDSTFLQLFPTFVKDFSNLLVDDEYVQLKRDQLLNTELRIYALMRLGITDGVKMSQFLRCSLSTIYNYRTKIRNKAIGSRDEFEEKVLQIGSLVD